MPDLIMFVGLPGSGKSYWADIYSFNSDIPVEICSSDQIREELFGDAYRECTPKENERVFNVLHKKVKQALREGKTAIYDATNLNKKRRINFLNQLKGIPCRKRCVLLITEYELCLKHNRLRDHPVPESVIERMYRNFQPPHESEGWDEIEIKFECLDVDSSVKYTYAAFKKDTLDFDQESEHHKYTLWEHSNRTLKYIENAHVCKEDIIDVNLIYAAFYHDNGKLKTKTVDENGKAHYYQHHCVGAYDSFLYLYNPSGYPDLIEIANLIYYHMHPYMSWKTSEKAKNRDRKLLGEEMFNKILLLHEADVAAH